MTRVVQDSDRPWLPLGGEGENFMKIISVDETQRQVVLLVKFGPHAVYPQHLHLAGAVAYTIDGQWEYEEGVLGKGAWALEPPGTDHLPIISEKGATILAILTSKDDQFVEVPLPDGSRMRQDLAYFKRLYAMTPEEAARENASGIQMTTRR
jgi:quercetin dioxygenase-like cupin family protein